MNTKKAVLPLILLATAALYIRTLQFGIFWDDPVWYGHLVGKSWSQLALPTGEYHFYRPTFMLYTKLFLRGDNTLDPYNMHWAQISWHLLNVSLTFTLARKLRLGDGAYMAALLMAVYPFAYQAVAWSAPSQPMAAALQNLALLLFLMAREAAAPTTNGGAPSRLSSRSRRWLMPASATVFLLALGTQESTVTFSLVPFLCLLALQLSRSGWGRIWQWLKQPVTNGWLSAAVFPLLAILFLAVWLQAPRYGGVIGVELDWRVAAYLLQGVAYPLLGRPAGYAPGSDAAPGLVGIASAAVMAILLVIAMLRRRGTMAMVACLWIILMLLPSFVGLTFDYATIGSRLLYSAGLPLAVLWTAALAPSGSQRRKGLQLAGTAALLAIVIQSVTLLRQFDRLYANGTRHLNQAIDRIADGSGPYLFVNFPDRLASKRGQFPLGYWGLPLAPVSVDLDDFAPFLHGVERQTRSVAVPWIGLEGREAGPYAVDMRGVITPADQLYQLAEGQETVFLSDYAADGSITLLPVGSLRSDSSPGCRLVTYAGTLCLEGADAAQVGDELRIELIWSTTEPIDPNVTIFVHVGPPGQPPLVQADGDSWRGLMPLTQWQPGDQIVDLRSVPVPASSEPLTVQIGLYNRVSGERLPAASVDQGPLGSSTYSIPVER